jgi:Matrixin/Carboxypeptidase regulatory-like domain
MKRTLILMLLFTAPLGAYITQKGKSQAGQVVQIKWGPNSFPLTWQMNPVTGANITGTRQQLNVVQASFQAWSSIPSISFTQGNQTDPSVKPGYDGINLVTTNVTAADWAALGLGSTVLAFTDSFWFDIGGDGVLDNLGRPVSFPGQVLEADILFNPAQQFSTESTLPANSLDFQSVLTHEIGHFLGLDHTPIVSSTMFWTLRAGLNYPRVPSADDMAGVQVIYPTAAFSAKSTVSGTVRTTANAPVFGAVVVLVNSSGQPVASTLTDPNGQYTIAGLDAGNYTVYAQPLDGAITASNVYTLPRIYPGQNVNTAFTARFR